MPTESPLYDKPVYFIADIASNHNSSLDLAIELIHKAAEAGANAAKFQNFFAQTIVSDEGFNSLPSSLSSHQSQWSKSVYEVYDDFSLPLDWTKRLRDECLSVGIDYITSPYDLKSTSLLAEYVSSFKIGSGDITWPQMIRQLCTHQKPILLATGASKLQEVEYAVNICKSHEIYPVLMQCNTNYTGSNDNFKYINLNVLKSFSLIFPELYLGLSDHTTGHATVLGAVALGARYIEKHLTLDNNLNGPDHAFSMTPSTWDEMVLRTRELELALGHSLKTVEANEQETLILQRRSLYAARDLQPFESISTANTIALRPCPPASFTPLQLDNGDNIQTTSYIAEGDPITYANARLF